MLDFVKRYANNGPYSQNGESGILDECIARIKPLLKESVEFGACDGFYCSNTAHLEGWHKRMYDINPSGKVEKAEITKHNVNDIVNLCTILSIDTDGADYEIWEAYKFKPSIVIIEINSGLKPLNDFYSIEQGANYSTMVQLGLTKGYFLLCHTGNLIFIHGDHLHRFPEVRGTNPIKDWKKYFNMSWQTEKV